MWEYCPRKLSKMRKRILVLLVALLMVLSTGCASNEAKVDRLSEEVVKLEAEVNGLKRQKEELEAEIIEVKKEHGTARFIVKFKAKQVHYTLDLDTYLKDSMNELEFEVPVDEDYYNSVEVGTVISDDFLTGMLLVRGTFGSWEVKVVKKEIR